MKSLVAVFGCLAFLLAGGFAPARAIAASGLVQGPDGALLSAARVELVPLPPNYVMHQLLLAGRPAADPVVAAETDAAGRFSLVVPEAGVFKVIVRKEGYLPMRYAPLPLAGPTELPPVVLQEASPAREAGDGVPSRSAWVQAAPPQPTAWARLSARPEGLTIEVKETDGRPAADIVIAFGEPAWPVGSTGPDGTLRLQGVPAGPMEIHLLGADGWRQLESLEAGAEHASFVLHERRWISGQVVDAATGRPLPEVLVWPSHDPGTFVRSDAGGFYRLIVPPGERWWIQAEASGFQALALRVRPLEAARGRGPRLALRREALLTGETRDGRGRAVPGVLLEAVARPGSPPRANFRPDPAEGRAVSDAAGRFVIAGLRPGVSYRLLASREGFIPAAVEAGIDEAGPAQSAILQIVLARHRPVRGRLVDAGETPIPDAEIELVSAVEPEGEKPAAARPSRTDAAGRFEIAAPPAAKVDLLARKAGFAPRVLRSVRIPLGEGPVDLGSLVLEPGAALSGLVTAPDGTGIAGVSIRLGWRGRARPDAVTDAEGRFVIADLTSGQETPLSFDHEGFLPAHVPSVAVPTREPLRVVLQPAAAVTGSVVDPDGQPVAGATVALEPRELPVGVAAPPSGPTREVSATSDARGRFRVAGLAPGSYGLLAFAEGFQPFPAQRLDVSGTGPAEDLEIILERGAALWGKVVTTTGEPVSGARLIVGDLAGASDDDGLYRIAGIPPGPQTIEVRHREFPRVRREARIEPGENRLDLTLEAGHRVAGRIADETGAGVSGVSVQLAGHPPGKVPGRELEVTSGAAGRFALDHVPEGVYTLTAGKSGYVDAELAGVQVSSGPLDGVEIVLSHGAAVLGQIRGLTPGELSQVTVAAEDAQGAQRSGGVDHLGRFEILGLAPGDWIVRATLRGGIRLAQAAARLQPGEPRAEVDLEFRSGVTLTGHVSLAGAPLGGAQISLMGQDVPAARLIATRSDGRFVIEDLQPGWYRLEVSHPGELLTFGQNLHLTRPEDVPIEITTVRVSGRVVAARGGESIADAMVSFQQLVDGTDGAVSALGTGPGGEFLFVRMPEGQYRVTVQKAGFAPIEQEIEVRAGGGFEPLRLTLAPQSSAR